MYTEYDRIKSANFFSAAAKLFGAGAKAVPAASKAAPGVANNAARLFGAGAKAAPVAPAAAAAAGTASRAATPSISTALTKTMPAGGVPPGGSGFWPTTLGNPGKWSRPIAPRTPAPAPAVVPPAPAAATPSLLSRARGVGGVALNSLSGGVTGYNAAQGTGHETEGAIAGALLGPAIMGRRMTGLANRGGVVGGLANTAQRTMGGAMLGGTADAGASVAGLDTGGLGTRLGAAGGLIGGIGGLKGLNSAGSTLAHIAAGGGATAGTRALANRLDAAMGQPAGGQPLAGGPSQETPQQGGIWDQVKNTGQNLWNGARDAVINGVSGAGIGPQVPDFLKQMGVTPAMAMKWQNGDKMGAISEFWSSLPPDRQAALIAGLAGVVGGPLLGGSTGAALGIPLGLGSMAYGAGLIPHYSTWGNANAA